VVYARDDKHKDQLLATTFKGKRQGRRSAEFKGLGEMPASQLKQTTMDPAKRTLLRVSCPIATRSRPRKRRADTAELVESLMAAT